LRGAGFYPNPTTSVIGELVDNACPICGSRVWQVKVERNEPARAAHLEKVTRAFRPDLDQPFGRIAHHLIGLRLTINHLVGCARMLSKGNPPHHRHCSLRRGGLMRSKRGRHRDGDDGVQPLIDERSSIAPSALDRPHRLRSRRTELLMYP